MQAAWLFAASGLLAVFALMTPGDVPRRLLGAIGAGDLIVAMVIAVLPWRSWPRSATLAILFPGFALVGASSAAGLIPVRAYGVFFVLVFAWVGTHHPAGTGWKVTPLAIAGFVVPLLITKPDPPLDGRAPILAIAVCVLVSETLARGARKAWTERDRADRTARAFRIVARTSASLRQLDPEGVLDAVVDGVMQLGYDGANLSVIDPVTDTFEPTHARGLAVAFAGRSYPASQGIPGLVRDAKAPVALTDYQSSDRSMAEAREAGIQAVLGVPVFVNDQLAAVLIASYHRKFDVTDEDLETLDVLATVAGTALLAAQQYQTVHATAEREALAARTDALTGLANRRAADGFLDEAHPGDALVMLDLDFFRHVNERNGHAGGDRVLETLGAHLNQSLRRDDLAARFGGEEFVVLLPRTAIDEAAVVIDRLMASWRVTSPATTFSAGVAVIRAGETPAHALVRADGALYEAKRRGRDQCRSELDLHTSRPPAVSCELSANGPASEPGRHRMELLGGPNLGVSQPLIG